MFKMTALIISGIELFPELDLEYFMLFISHIRAREHCGILNHQKNLNVDRLERFPKLNKIKIFL